MILGTAPTLVQEAKEKPGREAFSLTIRPLRLPQQRVHLRQQSRGEAQVSWDARQEWGQSYTLCGIFGKQSKIKQCLMIVH